MTGFQILGHTADIRLKVVGKDYEELFKNSALGLAKILDNNFEKKIKFIRGFEKIVINADNYDILLVNFLNEILTKSSINKKVYPLVKILKLSPLNIEAHISGYSINRFDKDVKAISYHQSQIIKTKRGLEVIFVLDI
ncbi:MAG: archease [Minisyncoccia bacterium]